MPMSRSPLLRSAGGSTVADPSRRAMLVGLASLGLGACASNPLGGATIASAREVPEASEEFRAWVADFRPRALGRGISASTYDRVMGAIVPDTAVYAFDKSQPEVQQPIWRYVEKRAGEYNVATGRKRIQEYAALWDRIEAKYGVDRYVLCALWGLETSFGDLVVTPKYNRPVLPCLAALAWGEPRRRRYWEAELLNALVIVDRGWADPSDMIGSWAGAMGHTQWMPEVWLAMGVDFDGDGRINPFGRPDDGLAGTARYLVERGHWRRGEAWGYEVSFEPGFDWGDADGKTRKSVGHWVAGGVRRADGKPFPDDGSVARIWLPAGSKGPAFALLQNFFAVRSYNPSSKYALAICHLADKIRGEGTFVHPWPTDEKPLSVADAQELQERLTALGYDTGGADGRVGDKTSAAVQAWQRAVGMRPADGYPSDKVLERLRGG